MDVDLPARTPFAEPHVLKIIARPHTYPGYPPEALETQCATLQVEPRAAISGTAGDICCPDSSTVRSALSVRCKSLPHEVAGDHTPSPIRPSSFQRAVPSRWFGNARTSILTVEACRDPRRTLSAPIYWDGTNTSPDEDFMIPRVPSRCKVPLLTTAVLTTSQPCPFLHQAVSVLRELCSCPFCAMQQRPVAEMAKAQRFECSIPLGGQNDNVTCRETL